MIIIPKLQKHVPVNNSHLKVKTATAVITRTIHVHVHVHIQCTWRKKYMYIHTRTVHYTFLVVEEAVVPHEHPVVVEGGRDTAGMEHGQMVL